MFLSQSQFLLEQTYYWSHFIQKRILKPDFRHFLPICFARHFENGDENQPGAEKKAFVQRFRDCRT